VFAQDEFKAPNSLNIGINFVLYYLDSNWNFRSHVLSLPRAKVPYVELSLTGTFVPWNTRSLEFSFPGTFTLWKFRSPGPNIAIRVKL